MRQFIGLLLMLGGFAYAGFQYTRSPSGTTSQEVSNGKAQATVIQKNNCAN